VLREFFRLSVDAPLPPPPTGKVADNPSFTHSLSSLWEGRRTDPPPATAGAARYPRSVMCVTCVPAFSIIDDTQLQIY